MKLQMRNDRKKIYTTKTILNQTFLYTDWRISRQLCREEMMRDQRHKDVDIACFRVLISEQFVYQQTYLLKT